MQQISGSKINAKTKALCIGYNEVTLALKRNELTVLKTVNFVVVSRNLLKSQSKYIVLVSP